MTKTETVHIPAVGSATRPSSRIAVLARIAARDFVYLLAVLGLSFVALLVWVTGVALSVSLSILIVGFAAWLGTVYAALAIANIDRRLAGWLRREPIPRLYIESGKGNWRARLRAATNDPQTWKDLGWIALNSVSGFLLASAAITLTGLVISYIAMPLWWWAIPDPHHQYATLNLGIYTVTSTGRASLTTALGLSLTPLTVAINHAVASGHAAAAASILGPSERQLTRHPAAPHPRARPNT